MSSWLGGLDSNQDNQIQNLMYCQLYDLPAEGEATKKGRSHDPNLLYWWNRSSSTTCAHINAPASHEFHRNIGPRIAEKLFMAR
jgi:hypothetical protein